MNTGGSCPLCIIKSQPPEPIFRHCLPCEAPSIPRCQGSSLRSDERAPTPSPSTCTALTYRGLRVGSSPREGTRERVAADGRQTRPRGSLTSGRKTMVGTASAAPAGRASLSTPLRLVLLLLLGPLHGL